MNITTAELEARVADWQTRLEFLGVGHWRINGVTMSDTVPGQAGSSAAVFASANYDSATFCFATDYVKDSSAQELDETIIHEWLHVAFRDLDNAVELVEPWMPAQTYETFDENVRQRRESLIERLARLVYTLKNPRARG